MSSLAWSTDLKFSFKASRKSDETKDLSKTLNSNEAKVLSENKQTVQEVSTMAFWN